MRRNVIETVMGGVVLVVAAFFLVFAYTSADLTQVDGYEVSASFTQAAVSPGTDVRISGVTVGSVIEQRLDEQTYLAVVRMSIDPSINLPQDTVAVIEPENLLGGNYIRLDPGGAEETIPPGGTIQYTQTTPSLGQLIGRFIYGGTDSAPAGGGDAGAGDGDDAGGFGGGLLGTQ